MILEVSFYSKRLWNKDMAKVLKSWTQSNKTYERVLKYK